ncbi:hypothetical protein FE257_006280 [Aspergillus nanangensis]|uniref:SigF-like NTF2-like domain-containing protein n=1 Tax=Aspergillus nanangensis TaxID=2582783 RepID=A0AAD4CP43_ASPNN|nr:hypothetical protein FE257_006280 [Aspergillus nanangensis]
MENPETEIETVIEMLTEGDEHQQATALDQYFTEDAAFIHPFYRVRGHPESRESIQKVYQWCQLIYPNVAVEIHSTALDEEHLKLYVTMSHTFAFWFLLFHSGPVVLTTVLNLQKDSLKDPNKPLYYITQQEDFYQTSEFVKFVVPRFGDLFVISAQLLATWFCMATVCVCWPFIRTTSGVNSKVKGQGGTAVVDDDNDNDDDDDDAKLLDN